MTRSTTIKTLLPLVLGAAAVAPASHAFAASKTKTVAYKGSAISSQWGTVQATVYVRSKKIIDVRVASSTHTARSGILNSEALPTLRQEVLQAQSAHVNLVSGATTISQAYLQSVETALTRAHLA
jgi:uncharacterized protein with FMN-binding domain